MKLKDILIFTFVLFCIIVTGQVVFQAILKGGDYLNILVMAFVSALPALIFTVTNNDSPKGFFLQLIFHFALTASIVLGLLLHFEYIRWNFTAVFIFVLFIVIYVTGFLGYLYYRQRMIKKLNAHLSAFRKDRH